MKKIKLTLIEIFSSNFFLVLYCYLWLWSLQSSPFSKPLFPNSSSISFQLLIFFSSLLSTTFQLLFPLLLVLLNHRLTATILNRDSIFLNTSIPVTFLQKFWNQRLDLQTSNPCIFNIPIICKSFIVEVTKASLQATNVLWASKTKEQLKNHKKRMQHNLFEK